MRGESVSASVQVAHEFPTGIARMHPDDEGVELSAALLPHCHI